MSIGSDHVGMQIRRWRLRRGLSQRALAELAGFTQGYIGRIETGSARLEKRTSQQAIADVLQVSVAELTGHHDPSTRYRLVRQEQGIASLRASFALLSCPGLLAAADEQRDHGSSVDHIVVSAHFNSCRYDLLVPALADALTDLAYRVYRPDADCSTADLRSLVSICSDAMSTCRQLGYDDLALLAGQHCRAAAQRLHEPTYLGVANYTLAQSVFAHPGAAGVALQGIDMLSPYVASDRGATEAYGMHHLLAAKIAARDGRDEAAFDHLDEARRVADQVGDPVGEFFQFGPTNTVFWRLAVLVELGDKLGRGHEPALPPGCQPESIPSASRLATYYIDHARALLLARGTESEAMSALRRAEAIAPQHVRTSADARSAVRTLLMRPRPSRRRDLRDLADRVGLAD